MSVAGLSSLAMRVTADLCDADCDEQMLSIQARLAERIQAGLAMQATRERRFSDDAKLMLALLRGRITYASHFVDLEERLEDRERCRAHDDKMRAMEDELMATRAATARGIASAPHLDDEQRILGLEFLGDVAASPRNRHVLNAARRRQRAEDRYDHTVKQADEAFQPYRTAIIDAVLHWSRSRPGGYPQRR